MRPLLCLLISAFFLLAACSEKKLVKRIPGSWYIDHYDEYSAEKQSTTGHALDGAGYMFFTKHGEARRRLLPVKPHGSLAPYTGYRWSVQDTLISITDGGGRLVEEWLITKQLADYMEWVSVNASRDTVRTMYLKR